MTKKLITLTTVAAIALLTACSGSTADNSTETAHETETVQTTTDAATTNATATTQPVINEAVNTAAAATDTVQAVVSETVQTAANTTATVEDVVTETVKAPTEPVKAITQPVKAEIVKAPTQVTTPTVSAQPVVKAPTTITATQPVAVETVQVATAATNLAEPAATEAVQATTNAAPAPTPTPEPVITKPDPNAIYTDFLNKYISDKDGINFVAYGKVSDADHAALKSYIASLEARGTAGMNDDEIKAFWFNLYNAETIDVILDNYPLKSIRSLGSFNRGPWDRKLLNVAGKGEMSLNDIEHGTLREMYDEPRIHYAVNCASYGCPNLKATVWTAENLEADLTAAAIAYINHPRGVRVEGNKVIASKIFDWYKVDFGGNQTGMLNHFRQYARGELATQLNGKTKVSKFEYNWNLNE